MKVICISGKAQHGKDTTAGMMKTALEGMGHTVLIAHYGDLLKYVCRAFFGWNGEKDAYGRSLLQKVGTDIVREQRPNFWVDFIKDLLSMFPNEWDFVIIPDSRFPNEIESLKQAGLRRTHGHISHNNGYCACCNTGNSYCTKIRSSFTVRTNLSRKKLLTLAM